MSGLGADDTQSGARLAWLPAATTIRFVLLVAAVLGSGTFLFRFLAARFIDIKAVTQAAAACSAANLRDPLVCDEPGARRTLRWDLTGLVGILIGAAAVYQVAPRWVVRRNRLTLMEPQDAPEAAKDLEGAFVAAGLRRPPRVYWNPLNAAVNGLAFGTGRRPCIGLSGGMVSLFYARQQSFRAVLLHEMAHWSLGDVPVTYVTTSIWFTFALGALLPGAAGLIGQSLDSVLHIGLRMAALGIVVYLARNAVLRSREYYADLCAAREPDVAEEIVTLILRDARDAGTFLSRFGVHPSAQAREAVLRFPARLLRQSRAEAFGAGVIAAVGFSTTAMMMGDLTVVFRVALDPLIGALSNLPWHLASLIFTPLLAAVGGAAAWRRALSAEGLARGAVSVAGQSVLTACGLVVGEQLALDSQLSWEQTQPWGFAGVILVNLAGAGVVAACLMCLFVWQHAAAWGWLRRGVGPGTFRLWFWVSVASSIPAMTLCFGEVLALRLNIDGPPLDIASAAQVGPTVAKILASLFANMPRSLLVWSAVAGFLVPVLGVVLGVMGRRKTAGRV